MKHHVKQSVIIHTSHMTKIQQSASLQNFNNIFLYTISFFIVSTFILRPRLDNPQIFLSSDI